MSGKGKPPHPERSFAKEKLLLILSVSNSISALSAHATKLAVSANNIANVETEAFKKSRAVLQEGANGSVKVEIQRVDTPGPVVEDSSNDQYAAREMSNVDLGEEIPQTMIARRGYEANLSMIRTADEMLGSVINILG
jgi:flagellar hook protein FlgE